MTAQMQRLIEIMQQLRNKETGCPWDTQQTHASIARYCLEEAYEVVEAIEQQNPAALREELGDLLLQVVFHAQMASEAGSFDLESVAEGICEKMLRRHPHVFGDAAVSNVGEVHANWEDIKAKERAEKSADASILADIPAAFPALTRAQKLQKRAASVGFDWPDASSVYAKIEEEMHEVQTAQSAAHRAEEIGDLLFSVVNLARHYHIDAEEALRHANAKFERRFRHVESHAPKPLKQTGLEQMEALWQKAKKAATA